MNPQNYIKETMKMVSDSVRKTFSGSPCNEIELVDIPTDKGSELLEDIKDSTGNFSGNYILGDCIYDRNGDYVGEVADEDTSPEEPMNQAEEDCEIETLKKYNNEQPR